MSLPLHEQIRSYFQKAIMDGALKPGEKIASERALMQRYNCSRMTVNKALSMLCNAGFVERRRRTGTVVARPQVHSMVLDIPDLSVEISERGQSYGFRLVHAKIRAALSSQPEERELAGRGKLLQVDCVHLADAVPLAAEFRIVNLGEVPELAEVDLAAEPVGRWLLRHVPWTEVRSRITATAASGAEAELLKVSRRTPCLQVERWTWRNRAPVTYVRSVFVGSAYALTAHFDGSGPARAIPADRI